MKLNNIFKIDSILILALGFLVSQVSFLPEGGDNERSRFATLHSMANEVSFRIDHVQKWTGDWARTSDGHFFSNKAPGPMFVAFPLVWILDRLLPSSITSREGDSEQGLGPVKAYKSFISICFQVLPCFFLSLILLREFQAQGYSSMSLLYGGLSLLFANTAMVFMNIYFGHGMAACFIIMAVYAEVRGNHRLLGFALGLALLCDYGCALILLPWLVFGSLKRENRINYAFQLILGAVLPGVLWVWYHVSCFGSPLSLPMKFQNPIMVSKSPESATLIWGVISPIIHWDVLKNLLIGRTRGIAVTQLWVFVVFLFSIFFLLKKRPRSYENTIINTAIFSLIFLLWMNSGFNGWHGGGTAGPRYLSMVFPLFAVVSIFIYDSFGRVLSFLLWVTLLPFLLFRILVHASTPIPDYGIRLWPFFIQEALSQQNIGKTLYFVVLLGLTWGAAAFLALKKDSYSQKK